MSSSTPRFELPRDGEPSFHSWFVVGELIVSFSQEGAIPDSVWNRFVADVGAKTTKSVLGLSIGSVGINSVQRKAIAEAVKGRSLAAVLQSPVVRGILTAMSWFGINVKPFSWQNLRDSISYLGADPDVIEPLIKDLISKAGGPSWESLTR